MALIDGLLTHTCTIKAPVVDRQTRGGDKVTGYNTVATGVECIIDQASERDIAAMGGKQVNMSHIGYYGLEQKANLVTTYIVTDVAPIGSPTAIEMDDFGTEGQKPRQYRILNAKAPNLEPDHFEVGLEQMQGRPGAPE